MKLKGKSQKSEDSNFFLKSPITKLMFQRSKVKSHRSPTESHRITVSTPTILIPCSLGVNKPIGHIRPCILKGAVEGRGRERKGFCWFSLRNYWGYSLTMNETKHMPFGSTSTQTWVHCSRYTPTKGNENTSSSPARLILHCFPQGPIAIPFRLYINCFD